MRVSRSLLNVETFVLHLKLLQKTVPLACSGNSEVATFKLNSLACSTYWRHRNKPRTIDWLIRWLTEQMTMKDFSLNPAFRKACRDDAQQYCRQYTKKYVCIISPPGWLFLDFRNFFLWPAEIEQVIGFENIECCSQGYHFYGISGNLEMSGNSAKVREKSGKMPKVRERSWNLCSQGNLIVAAQQNNFAVLFSYRNSFLYMMFTENVD